MIALRNLIRLRWNQACLGNHVIRPFVQHSASGEAELEGDGAVKLSYHKFETEKQTDKQPILVMHGLFGKKGNWFSFGESLCKETSRNVYIVDARNHGHSPHVEVMDYPSMSEDILLLMRSESITKPVLVGHSMGGRIAMTLALTKPLIVERLALLDVAPKKMNSKSYFSSYVSGMLNVDFSQANSLAQAVAQANEQLKNVVKEDLVRSFLLNNAVELEQGKFGWICNVENIGNNLVHLVRFTSYNRAYHSDALFIGGAESQYFTKADYPEVQRLFPRAEIKHVEGAGHWLHLDKPREVLNILVPFMNKPSSL